MKSPRAFTLVELLVTIAIIVLLIAILLPTLARAREQAKRAVCASHMKGIGTAFFTYGANNSDMVPDGNGVDFQWIGGQVMGGTNGDEENWPEVLVVDGDINVKYHTVGSGNATQDNFAQGVGIFWCPDALNENYTEVISGQTVHETGKPDGTAESAQSGYGMAYYAASIWYYSAGGAVAISGPSGNTSYTPPIGIAGAPNASGKLVLPYTMKTSFWRPAGIVLVEGDTGFNGAISYGAASSTRYGVYTTRHGQGSPYPLGANYLLGDGHAEWNTTWNMSDQPGQSTSSSTTFTKYPESDWRVSTNNQPKDYSVWGHNPNGQNGASGP